MKKKEWGYYELVGSSQALKVSVPAGAWEYVDNTPVIGGFSVVLVTNTLGGVVWMDITLNVEDAF